MEVKIDYKNMTSRDQAYDTVKDFITPELIAKFNVKADIDYNDAGKLVKAKGKGFDFSLDFADDHVLLALKLSILLRPLKGKILSALERQVKKVI